MEKKRFDNLIFVLFVIIVILISITMFFASLRPVSLDFLIHKINNCYNAFYSNILNQIILCLIAILFFILAIYLIQKRYHYKTMNLSVTQKTSFGEIRISLNSLNNLSLKLLGKMEEIKEAKPIITPVKIGGVNICLNLTVKQDVNIPELSEKIQKKLKDYLLETSGIEVKEIKINIDKVFYENTEKS
ncbi:MAG: alkaline shock response membrane anchor protein AmaP [Candidatus Caldatribacteriota bacterium]|nr:alkaline shock response membrane anchor protein AmaP [Candidatus Caldatribacteriota bacterium]